MSGVQILRGTGFQRVVYAKKWLEEFVHSHTPNLIVIEGYAYANPHTLGTLVEVGTAFRLGMSEEGFGWIDCPPTTLKKFVCGKGTAKKEHILLDVYKHWKVSFDSSDEADAFGLAMLGVAFAKSPGIPFLADQQRVADALVSRQ
jgi:crossover junction endodeoxyribonuclease RuvC